MNPLSLLAPLLLAAPVSAQVVVWQDQFNDGAIGLNWSLFYNAAQPWNVDESGGMLNFHGINTQTFSATNETYALIDPIPAISGEVTLRTRLEWEEHPNAPAPGGSYLDTRITLYDSSATEIAAIHLYDVNQGTEIFFWAGGWAWGASPLPQTSSADIEFTRDSSGSWTATVSGAAGSFSGTVYGSSTGDIVSVEIETTAINLQSSGSPLGTVKVDYVELLIPGTPPTLTLTGSCPGQMTADASNMTPNSPVLFGYGIPGSYSISSGPCVGSVVPLANPSLLATVTADAQGDASVSGNAPPIACGLILVAAFDLGSCTITNTVLL